MTFTHMIFLPEQGYWAVATRATIRQIDDSKFSKYAVVFPNSGSLNMGWTMVVPWWYVKVLSTCFPKVYFRTTQNMGSTSNVKLLLGHAGATDQATTWNAPAATDLGLPTISIPGGTPSGTIYEAVSTVAWAPGNTTMGQLHQFRVQRDNTVTGNASQDIEVLAVIVPFIQDVQYPRAGFWVPGHGYTIPIVGSGNAGFYDSTVGYANGSAPSVFLNANLDSSAEVRFRLPTNYFGSLRVISGYQATIQAGSAIWMVYGSVLPATGSTDTTPTLTFLASGTIGHSSGNTSYRIIDKYLGFSPLNVGPGDEVVLRFTRPGIDAVSVAEEDYGSFIFWDTRVKSPANLRLTANMASTSASGCAQLVGSIDGNGSPRWILRFLADRSQRADWMVFNNGAIRDQFKIRLKWKTQTSAGTGIQIKFSIYKAAVGSNDEVALTPGPVRTLSGNGNNFVNEFVEDYFNDFFTASTIGEYGIRLERVSPSVEFDYVESNVEFRATDTGV